MMICPRCGGLMQWERVHWRSRLMMRACLACGERTDETILANRRSQAMMETPPWQAQTWDRILRLVDELEVSA